MVRDVYWDFALLQPLEASWLMLPPRNPSNIHCKYDIIFSVSNIDSTQVSFAPIAYSSLRLLIFSHDELTKQL